MSFEEPSPPRFTTRWDAGALVIEIPPRRNWLLVAFLGFWLVGWAFGECAVLAQLFRAGHAAGAGAPAPKGWPPGVAVFMLAWLGAWTVGGGFALYAWLTQVFGVEELSLSSDALRVSKRVPGWTRSKLYRLSEARDLRAPSARARAWDASAGLEFWGVSGGALAFDYGAKTVRLGAGLDEAEARQIVRLVGERCPRLVSSAA